MNTIPAIAPPLTLSPVSVVVDPAAATITVRTISTIAPTAMNTPSSTRAPNRAPGEARELTPVGGSRSVWPGHVGAYPYGGGGGYPPYPGGGAAGGGGGGA